MKKDQNLDVRYDFFSGERVGDVIVLRLKENMMHYIIDLEDKGLLFDYLELVSKTDSVKVLLIIGSPKKMDSEEYIEFYCRLLEGGLVKKGDAKLYNALNQLILEMVSFNKLVIHADSGNLISLYVNVSLACDYRIIGDNSIFQNPYLDLGLVPKGGGAFFLSKMLGASKAFEVLLSGKDLSAEEALGLGIVDKIVPSDKLDEEAVKTAQAFARKPVHSMLGIKRLLNCCTKDLENCLKCEDELLYRIIHGSDFRKRLREWRNLETN